MDSGDRELKQHRRIKTNLYESSGDISNDDVNAVCGAFDAVGDPAAGISDDEGI